MSWRATDVSDAVDNTTRWLSRRYDLTARQTSVLELLIIGRRNREIAVALGITVRTVRAHVGAIFQKTGIDGREELTRLLLEVMVDGGRDPHSR